MHQRSPSGIVYVSSRHQRVATASFGTLALRARLIPVLAGGQIRDVIVKMFLCLL